MSLAPGTRLGPYEIIAPLGAGGMGEVYRARDTRLGRDVAIKALPAAFAQDPERLARFEREAKLLASLSHPNVAVLYGLEEVLGARYLALEFIEGETLASRLARGPLALEEALEVARQIAAGVEAAHEKDVVHRDLKPGNVMLSTSGAVKVLDFGLARSGATDRPGSDPNLSASPTMTHAATSAGVILGTAAYMSPEQARGKAIDKRTDIWSFGCVLFECLTRRQAFAGETVSDIVASILQGEPDWTALPARTPERVRGLLRRCLEKDAKRRMRDIGDARIEIDDVLATRVSGSSIAAGGAPATGSRRRQEWARLAGVALLTAAVTWFAPRMFRGSETVTPARFTIPQPEGVFLETDGASAKLSPDGRALAFVAYDSTGGSRIWVRSLESTVARPIAGTDKTDGLLFWSPDGRQIAFASEEKLKKIPVAGGDAEVVCPVKAMRGGSWSREGVILVALNSNGPIYRVPANGGEPQPVTSLDSTRGETAHRFPQFLPDGRHFLFSALPARAGKYEIYVGSLDSPKRRLLLSAGSGVTLAPGHLLYARDGKLVAQEFDAKAIELRGDPVSLGDPVMGTIRSGGPIVSASATGSLAYGTLQVTHQRLAWVDLAGREIAQIPLAPGPYSFGDIAPDDRRVALTRFESADASDVWIADLERGVATRFTDEPGDNISPVWSPDGTRIAYTWSNNSPQVIKVRSLVGDTVETFLDSDPLFKRLHGWTPDGRSIIYSRLDPETQWDLWVLPLDGDRTPRAYLKTRFNETNATVSRDGRWIAYQSDESGQFEGYVQSFPVPGGKYQVTTGGGFHGGWSQDGKRLFFGLPSKPDQAFAAEVLGGSEFRLGPPRLVATIPKDQRGIALDHTDRRALALLPAGPDPTPSLTVVLDGLPGAARR